MSLTKNGKRMDHDLTEKVKSYWNENLHDLRIAQHPIRTEGFFEDLREYLFDKQRHLEKVLVCTPYDAIRVFQLGCARGHEPISSAMPSAKYSCSGSPDMFWNGSTAIDGLPGSARAGSARSTQGCHHQTPPPPARTRRCRRVSSHW